MLLKFLLLSTTLVMAVEWPDSCKKGQYYNSGLMSCASCNANVSLVTSDDGELEVKYQIPTETMDELHVTIIIFDYHPMCYQSINSTNNT